MKAITLKHPWAALVAIGVKQIETRSWRTNYKGPIAIHASKGFPKMARQITLQDALISHALISGLREIRGESLVIIGTDPWLEETRGHVIATAELTHCTRIDAAFVETISLWEKAYGNYATGRWAWHLENIQRITPIPAKGMLSVWEWNP